MFNATRQDFERVYTENGLTAPPSPAVPKTGSRPVSAAAAAGTKSLKADPAPHWVVYHNAWRAGGPPPVADVAVRLLPYTASSVLSLFCSSQGFNAFIITFLLTSGPFDMALEWANIGADARAAKKAEYNDAGIKLMISAFGATDHPTTAGADPVSLANTMAQYVKDYNLDGIDVDWEVRLSRALFSCTLVLTVSEGLRRDGCWYRRELAHRFHDAASLSAPFGGWLHHHSRSYVQLPL